MKKIYLLTAIITAFCATNAKAQAYQLTYSNATYTPLTNATILTNGLTWDDPGYNIPFGFTFQSAGRNYDTLQTSGATNFLGDSALAGLGSLLVPYNVDLIDRAYVDMLGGGQPNGVSPISYEQSGVAGSRILKIQYENAGFYEEEANLGTTLDSVNYQVWFYEGTNEMEVRFGPNSMRNDSLVYYGESGPAIAVIPNYDLTLDTLYSDFFYVTGDSTSPTLARSTSINTVGYLNGTPVNGGFYKFTPLTVGLEGNPSPNLAFTVYPNPAQNALTLELKSTNQNSLVQMFDLSGKVVFKERLSGFKNQIDVSEFTNGIYFLRVGNTMQKVVVSR